MDKKIKLLGLWGFATVSLLGTILHFLYDWSGKITAIAPFSSVNESTFEHMKLLFWPMLLFALIEWLFLRERDDFWCVALRSILIGLSLIPILFYTYNGVIGKSPDWINITIFFISAFISYFYRTRKLLTASVRCKNPAIPILILVGIAILFIIFTFMPPKLNIFIDPEASAYGIA